MSPLTCTDMVTGDPMPVWRPPPMWQWNGHTHALLDACLTLRLHGQNQGWQDTRATVRRVRRALDALEPLLPPKDPA